MNLRPHIFPVFIIGAAFAAGAHAAESPPEPRLFRTKLRLEPTLRQVATMPVQTAQWRLAPTVAAQLDSVMSAAGFSPTLAESLRTRLKIDRSTGEGIIVPDAGLLDQFTETERARWWAVLAGHTGNRAHRWPVAIRTAVLEELELQPAFAEAARRVRRWGVASGPRILFSELPAIGDAFAGSTDRDAFLQRFLGADTEFVKIVKESSGSGIDSAAAYWEGGGRSRALEPILNAIRPIEGHDRVDVAHLLPRLARALLYTFPPDFRTVEDPAIENATMATGFFDPAMQREEELRDGFSTWLGRECDVVTDGPREFGDIIVFEDPTRTRWPYSVVYLADRIVFGRRPSLYGPWELLELAEIARVNPRFRGAAPLVFRRKPAPSDNASAGAPPAWAGSSELKQLPAGPWGRLRYYEVLLAPSSELLETVPEPERQAQWTFRATTAGEIEEAIEEVPMPDATRLALQRLFDGIEPGRGGRITVRPDRALVLATPPAFRERLFGNLVHGALATDHAQDVLIPTRAGAAEWFAPETLSAREREIVLSLVYPRGNGLMLSDFGTLFHEMPDPAERVRVLQTLFRTPALVVLLERPEPDEVEELADYWRLDQQKSVRRILQSFAETREMRYIDIVHLLPPLSRELMNVYLALRASEPTPSCYWSSLNFAAERPDSRLLVKPASPSQEGRDAWRKLRATHDPVEGPSRLGDIIVYRRKTDGELVHMCAFIAAGIAYTKNGFGYSNPWCLMQLDDIDALYAVDETIERLAFRLKESSK
ncbi:MAG TPA: hypothetical protein VIK52_04865 [Opitutaceae bacterium]